MEGLTEEEEEAVAVVVGWGCRAQEMLCRREENRGKSMCER